LAVVPSPAPSPFAGYAANGNAQSAARVLDQILAAYPTDPAVSPLTMLTPAQNSLIDAATSLPPTQAPLFLRELSGQVHAAMVAVVPQALGNALFGGIAGGLRLQF
jgi:hypothetical protein